MVQCSECGMWRIIFSRYKLRNEQRQYLQVILDDFMYSCGASLKDLNLTEEYNDIEIRDHDCFDPIEKLYYSAKNQPICVYCGEDQPYTSDNSYPMCATCQSSGKSPISKK